MTLERLGEHRRPIATDSEEAQAWFDQGLALMYGFNFDGAIASFRPVITRVASLLGNILTKISPTPTDIKGQ